MKNVSTCIFAFKSLLLKLLTLKMLTHFFHTNSCCDPFATKLQNFTAMLSVSPKLLNVNPLKIWFSVQILVSYKNKVTVTSLVEMLELSNFATRPHLQYNLIQAIKCCWWCHGQKLRRKTLCFKETWSKPFCWHHQNCNCKQPMHTQ